MPKQRSFVVETTKSICSDQITPTHYSLAVELESPKIERLIIGLLLIKDDFIDSLLIKDFYFKEKITIERHERFHTSTRKGKLRARSIISKNDDNNWSLLITENDVKCIISWYLRAFIDDVYKHGVLDLECEETNMLMFATKKTG